MRQLLTIGGLLLGLLLSLQGAEQAAAIVKACRGDSIVWLSNGTKISMTASIAADASQVKLVTYIVHAPHGVSVDKVVYTGGVLKDKERVIVVFDRVSEYLIEARTNLGTTVAPVTINATVEKMCTRLPRPVPAQSCSSSRKRLSAVITRPICKRLGCVIFRMHTCSSPEI